MATRKTKKKTKKRVTMADLQREIAELRGSVVSAYSSARAAHDDVGHLREDVLGGIWKTAKGHRVPVMLMSTRHLKACLDGGFVRTSPIREAMERELERREEDDWWQNQQKVKEAKAEEAVTDADYFADGPTDEEIVAAVVASMEASGATVHRAWINDEEVDLEGQEPRWHETILWAPFRKERHPMNAAARKIAERREREAEQTFKCDHEVTELRHKLNNALRDLTDARMAHHEAVASKDAANETARSWAEWCQEHQGLMARIRTALRVLFTGRPV